MESKVDPSLKIPLLVVNAILLAVGNCGGPLIMRLYFLHGGHRVWLSACLETAGFPFTFIAIVIAYFLRRAKATASGTKTHLFHLKYRVFFGTVVVGVLTGVDDYFYAYGLAKLPVSTSAIIIASQLAFTALFAFLLVKQKFTSFSLNAVVLLTIGAGVLAMHTSSDKPKGESHTQYIIGFVMTLGAAALYGFVLPLMELTYNKAKQSITYTLVLEIQLVMCFFASLVCCIGMIINNDFKAIPKEARDFGLGETKYYVVLVFCAILWQCFFLGAIGVIFCASSLLSGIIIAVLLPVTEVLAVLCYQEKFGAEKGIALVLSLWGFVSYFYGEMRLNKKNQKKKLQKELELRAEVNNV